MVLRSLRHPPYAPDKELSFRFSFKYSLAFFSCSCGDSFIKSLPRSALALWIAFLTYFHILSSNSLAARYRMSGSSLPTASSIRLRQAARQVRYCLSYAFSSSVSPLLAYRRIKSVMISRPSFFSVFRSAAVGICPRRAAAFL